MATRSSGSDSEGESTLINLDSGNTEKNPSQLPVSNGKDPEHTTNNGAQDFAPESLKNKPESDGAESGPDSLDELEPEPQSSQVKFSEFSPEPRVKFSGLSPEPGVKSGLSPKDPELGNSSDSLNKLSMSHNQEKIFGLGAGTGLDELMGDYEASLDSDEARMLENLDNLELAKSMEAAAGGDFGGMGHEAVLAAFPPPPRTAPPAPASWETGESGIGKDLELLVQNVRKAGLIAPDARITPKELKTAELKKRTKPETLAQSPRSNGLGSSGFTRPSTTRPGSLNLGSAKLSSGSPGPKTPATARTARSRPSPSSLKGSPVTAASPDLLGIGTTKGIASSPDFTSRLYRPTTSASAKYSVNNLASTPTGSKGKISKSTSSPSPSPAKASTPKPKMGDAGGAAAGEGVNIKDQFTAFSKFGDATSDGKQITLSNADKWMKQAKVIDGKKITTTDTSIAFKKLFKTAKKVGLDDFKKYVEDLSNSKKLNPEETLGKLTNCGAPGLSQATKAAHASVVDRLTDTSKYTGSHKERFDASGKGRGIEGRREVKDESGYTAAFKGKLDEKKEEIVSPAPN